MKNKKFLRGAAIFFATVFVLPAIFALKGENGSLRAEAWIIDTPPLPAFQPRIVENGEGLSFESEEVTLTASALSGAFAVVQIESVSRLKNTGETVTAKMGVPFCGRAKSPPKIAVKTDGKETAGRIVYGGLYIRELGKFPPIDCAEPRAEESGSLYVFDVTPGAPFTYTVKTETDKPIFHDGCTSYRTREDCFTAEATPAGGEYELFVGGDSQIIAANAEYVVRKLTYDEYFEQSYTRLWRALAESGDADALSAPKEYHYGRYVGAIKQGEKWDIADFYLYNEELEIAMLYVFEWAIPAGGEGVLEVAREGEAAANTRFEPYKWNCEYRSERSVPRFSFTVFAPGLSLLENDLPFQKTERGYECFLDAAPGTVSLVLCASENPRDLLQTKKTPDTRKILSLVLAGVLFSLGVVLFFFGLRGSPKKKK